jgi:hypothetical protein
LALDLKVLPVEHIHQLVRILKAEAHKRDPAQAYRPALEYIVHRPAGPIRLQVMSKQRSGYSAFTRKGLSHRTSTVAVSGLGRVGQHPIAKLRRMMAEA